LEENGMMEGIRIGNYILRFYALLIVFGAVMATWLAGRLIRSKAGMLPGFKVPEPPLDESTGLPMKESEDQREARIDKALEADANRLTEMAWDIMPWALIGGIIGARLWHILLPAGSDIAAGRTTLFYLTNPLNALAVWKGGLGIPGAIIGGFIAVWIYCRRNEIQLGVWADAIAPGLALAQAIGRWGNYFNQEVYGAPTDLPWKLFISPDKRLPGLGSVEYYHPLFLYESLWNLANMGLLLWLGRRYPDKLRTWDLFFCYMVFYGVGRFLLEYLRLDPAPLGTVNGNQMFMLAVILGGVVGLVINRRKSASNL
jgi:phosphatidylglycerol:prolipoprotein diacylglycerol transferase